MSQRSNCQHPLYHRKSKGIPEKYLFLLHDYVKAFDCVDHNKLWKILKEMGTPDHPTCFLRNLYAGQEATLELDNEYLTGSRLGKEYVKAVHFQPAYLPSLQSTSCKLLGWMNHKLESRLPGEISTTSDMQMIPLEWQKAKRNCWWGWKRRVKKLA